MFKKTRYNLYTKDVLAEKSKEFQLSVGQENYVNFKKTKNPKFQKKNSLNYRQKKQNLEFSVSFRTKKK